MLAAYFDESYQGNGAKRVMALGGYISSVKRWNQFTKQWRERVLRPFHLKSFHMADCNARPPHGEFANWTPERCKEVQKIALPIIRRWALRGGASALIVPDFEELLEGLYLRHGIRKRANASIQDPYGWCFYGVVRSALEYARNEPGERPVALYFDRKEKVEGQSQEYFNKYCAKHDPENRFLKSITHTDRMSFPPLQAADVLAYEAAKELYNMHFRPEIPLRKSLEILNARNTVMIAYDDRLSLAPVIDRMIHEGRL